MLSLIRSLDIQPAPASAEEDESDVPTQSEA